MGLGDFLSGVGQVVQTGIETLPAIIAAGQGQGVVGPQLPTNLFNQLQLPAGTSAPMTTGGAGAACGGTFVPTQSRLRARAEIRCVNPSTGKIESWMHRGSPLVWSRDRSIAKSYAKNAGFTLRRRGAGARRTTRRAPARRR